MGERLSLLNCGDLPNCQFNALFLDCYAHTLGYRPEICSIVVSLHFSLVCGATCVGEYCIGEPAAYFGLETCGEVGEYAGDLGAY